MDDSLTELDGFAPMGGIREEFGIVELSSQIALFPQLLPRHRVLHCSSCVVHLYSASKRIGVYP